MMRYKKKKKKKKKKKTQMKHKVMPKKHLISKVLDQYVHACASAQTDQGPWVFTEEK